MKRILGLLLVFILPAFCVAQTSANHQLPADVTVLESGWNGGVDWRSPTLSSPEKQLEKRRANNQLGPLDSEQTAFLRGGRNAAVVTIRNEGPKTIKRIGYDFIFFNTQNGKEFFRYQFRNRVIIGAGQTKTLTNETVGREPATGVDSEIRVVINRVEYADGSIWQRH